MSLHYCDQPGTYRVILDAFLVLRIDRDREEFREGLSTIIVYSACSKTKRVVLRLPF